GLGGVGVRPFKKKRRPPLQLFLVDDLLFEQRAGNPVEPVLVVAGAEIVGRVHALNGMAELVEVDETPAADSRLHRSNGRLPAVVKRRLVVVTFDSAKSMHATKIVDS